MSRVGAQWRRLTAANHRSITSRWPLREQALTLRRMRHQPGSATHVSPRVSRVIVLVFALAHATGAVAQDAQDAPMFRGNLAHTGVFTGAAPRSLHVKWSFPTGVYMISSPAV